VEPEWRFRRGESGLHPATTSPRRIHPSWRPHPAEVQHSSRRAACEHLEVEGDGRHFFAPSCPRNRGREPRGAPSAVIAPWAIECVGKSTLGDEDADSAEWASPRRHSSPLDTRRSVTAAGDLRSRFGAAMTWQLRAHGQNFSFRWPPLSGEVTISGRQDAACPSLCAALLAPEPVTLTTFRGCRTSTPAKRCATWVARRRA